MLDAPTSDDDQPPVSEAQRVEGWRLKTLLEAGYPVPVAEPLAANTRVDLHQAVALLRSGCSPELAADILT